MTTLGPDGRAAPAPGVHARTLDDELVVLDLAAGDYWTLDSIGTRLWHGLAEGLSPKEIADALQPTYDVTPERLLEDLVALADELLRRRLIVRR